MIILVREGGVTIGFSSRRRLLFKASGRRTSQQPARGRKWRNLFAGVMFFFKDVGRTLTLYFNSNSGFHLGRTNKESNSKESSARVRTARQNPLNNNNNTSLFSSSHSLVTCMY